MKRASRRCKKILAKLKRRLTNKKVTVYLSFPAFVSVCAEEVKDSVTWYKDDKYIFCFSKDENILIYTVSYSESKEVIQKLSVVRPPVLDCKTIEETFLNLKDKADKGEYLIKFTWDFRP